MRNLIIIVLGICSWLNTIAQDDTLICIQKMYREGQCYYVNIEGEKVTQEFEWGANDPWGNGLYQVRLNGKYGMIDSKGQFVVPCIYDEIMDFRVCIDSKCGLIDGDGNIIYPPTWYWIKDFFENYKKLVVGVKGKGYCLLDAPHNKIISKFYDEISNVDSQSQLLEVNNENHEGGGWLHGYIDLNGNEVIKLKYTGRSHLGVSDFKDGFVYLMRDKMCYKVYENGKEVPFGPYEYIYNVNDKGIMEAKLFSGGSVFIDKYGKIVPEPDHYGLVKIVQDGKYGFKNKKGRIVIPPIYDSVGDIDIEHGDILVKYMGRKILIDTLGNKLFEIGENEYVYNSYWGYTISKNNLHMLRDKKGNAITSFIYQKLEYFHWKEKAYCQVQNSNGFWGVLNDLGKEIVPCNYNFENVQLEFVKYLANSSPVDIEKTVPIIKTENDKTFVLVICNEEYLEEEISNVKYANRDGNFVKEYCMKTLGVPKDNIHFRKNTTLNQFKSEIRWIRGIADAFQGEANIIFYYAGHGVPDEKDGSAYILPVDGIPSDVESAYSLSKLYEELGKLPAKQITVLLDACFSGATRSGDVLLANARGIMRKAKPSMPCGNMVVLSAAQGDETAYTYKEKKHGLFTYYLLKKLQETKGNVTLGELSDYIKQKVAQHSIVKNGKSQTPAIVPSQSLDNSWRNMKLR